MIIIILFLNINLFGYSLQEIYDNANSFENYDKYLILSPEHIYTGGLGLYEGNTYIDCNGAIINLEDGTPLYYDSHHLSLSGASLLKPIFTKILK